MKTTILLLICAAGLSAQSLAVTSPANGSVVTWGFSLTAAPTSLPSLTQVRFYIDGRLECIANALYLGSWSCTQGMRYPTYSDERAATIYAEAYNAVGTKIATSATNTFRINNVGLNTVTTFNFSGGPVTKGATVSGNLSFAFNFNVASITGSFNGNYNIDGVQPASGLTMNAPNSSVNLTTGSFTVPMITLPNGAPIYISCSTRSGAACAGVAATCREVCRFWCNATSKY